MSEGIVTAEQVEGARRFLQMVQLSVQRQRLAPNINAGGSDPFQRSHAGVGQSYSGARNYDTVLGRKSELKFQDYWELYERGGLAGALIDVRAEDTWGEPPQVTENDKEDTEFVRAFTSLVEQHHFWDVLKRVDSLSGIGEYGVLLFGLAGAENLSEEVKKGSKQGLDQLLYLRPFHEGGATIKAIDKDPSSPRHGYPVLYDVQLTREERAVVHHSRVLHLTEHRTDSEVYGRPWLKRPYDTLYDLIYKILGGSAEAAWLGMRKGAVIGPKEGYDLDLDNTTELGGLKDQLEAYAHDLARFLISTGVDVQEIGGADVWDPRSLFDVHVDVVAAESRVPKHILLGSAAGELASSESDDRRWAGVIRRRQNNYAGPRILRKGIDRLIWYGILPEPANGYEIGALDDDGNRNWPSIIQMTDEQAANISLRKSTAMKQFADPATGTSPFTKKEQRAVVGFSPEVPEDMEDDEPEQPAQPGVPGQPEGQPAETPGLDGVPELTPPDDVGEPDEEEERQRANVEVQQVRFIPEGAEKPVLDVPPEIPITETDIDNAIELWNSLMPEQRGMLDTESVEGRTQYDDEQY